MILYHISNYFVDSNLGLRALKRTHELIQSRFWMLILQMWKMIYSIKIWDSCGDVYKLEVYKAKPRHNKQTKTHREEKQKIILRFIFMTMLKQKPRKG